MSMRVVVLEEHGDPLALESVSEPDCGLNGVVVETEACGICRSDWHAWQGHGDWVDDRVPTGQVLGHEPVGVVREVDADVSMDALGSTETFRTAVGSFGSGGTHVQVGLTGDDDRGEVSLPVDTMVQDDLTVTGSRGMPPRRYDEVFAMSAAGQLDPAALVTERVALADVPDRLAAMSDFDTVGVEVVTEC